MLTEGPLGNDEKGSWIVGARKSYLQYVIQRTSEDPTAAFGFADFQGKLSYDFGPRQNIGLSVLRGTSGLDRTGARDGLGLNSIMTSDFSFTLANLAWRYAPHDRLLVTNRVAYLEENGGNRNRHHLMLGRDGYGEWIWQAEATRMWTPRHSLHAGWSLRHIHDNGFQDAFLTGPSTQRRLDEFRGTGVRTGAYIQQSWTGSTGRIVLTGGLRWDRHSVNAIQSVSPRASMAVFPLPKTQIHLGWGQYVQYPEVQQFFSVAGNRRLLPERANHLQVTVEQRMGERTRLRLEWYQRWDRDLLFRPSSEARVLDGQILAGAFDAPIRNASRGHARGFQVFLQRRAAKGLTGWISYAAGHSRLWDGAIQRYHPADLDQRHTVNVFGCYPLRPTVNLSARWIYGSGFPIPGYWRRDAEGVFLAESRNRLRLQSYQRADVGLQKNFVYDRFKIMIYGEMINLFDHDNTRFDRLRDYDSSTGRANLRFERLLPIMPSGGIAVEF